MKIQTDLPGLEHQDRVHLATAQGWTDIRVGKHGQLHGIDPNGDAGTVPDPERNDRDAALLRAWLVNLGCRIDTVTLFELCQVDIRRGLQFLAKGVARNEGGASGGGTMLGVVDTERLALVRAAIALLEGRPHA